MSWNPKTSLAMADDCEELQTELLQLWLTQAPIFIEKLAADRAGGLGEQLHRLKGSLQIMGADCALSQVTVLEDVLRNDETHSIETQLESLEKMLLKVTEEVNDWLLTSGRIKEQGVRQ